MSEKSPVLEQPAIRAENYNIPTEVVEAYSIDQGSIAKLGGGLVNLTYTAETDSGRIALQRLAPNIPETALHDFIVFTNRLRASGWLSPLLKANDHGKEFTLDQKGRLWRGMEYIGHDSKTPRPPYSEGLLETAGVLLARWHDTMSWLEHQPKHQIPHFHDTAYHMRILDQVTERLPGSCQSLARDTIKSYGRLDPLPESPHHLIHGDPKIDNILFRNSRPVTLIDLDTVMRGSVWKDIGDMTRSFIKTSLRHNQSATDTLHAISVGYFDAARPGIRLQQFEQNTSLATKHISLELLARYLVDIVEASYFVWDKHKFDSRADNHLSRAQAQWDVFQMLQNKE